MRRIYLLIATSLLAACASAPEAPTPAVSYETAHQTYVQGNIPLAVQRLMPLVSDGDIRAQRDLGIIYTSDTTHYSFDKGRQLLEMAATRGDAQAQFAYARLYGMPTQLPSYQTAHGWYQKAADQGLPEAEVQVGEDWLRGYGGLANNEVALGWFKKAADAGDVAGIGYLGQMYYYGLGVKQDATLGIKLIQQAADADDRRSDLFLGNYYKTVQTGSAEDAGLEAKYYAKAAATPFKDMLDMADGMKGIIDGHKVYPKEAMNIKVTQSSGFKSLDEAATRAVSDSTFPARPPALAGIKHFKIRVNFMLTPAAVPPAPGA